MKHPANTLSPAPQRSPLYGTPIFFPRYKLRGFYIQAFQPTVAQHNPIPDVLPEILLLAEDPDPNAANLLATGLWIKYRTSADWAWKVWDNAVASLRQVPVMVPEAEARYACAMKYGAFLWQVDQHLPHGIDGEVLRWFLGPGKSETSALCTDAWHVLTTVLLYLSIRGALKTTTLLQGLVYPAWQLGASITKELVTPSVQTLIAAGNDLCRILLLQEEGTPILPSNLLDIQCIQTRRQEVYSDPHFPLFVSSIPLLILLESNPNLPEHLRSESTSLRNSLCQDRHCRQGAHRNLGAIQEAFEQSLHLMDEDADSVGKNIVSGLRILLGDYTDGRLSPLLSTGISQPAYRTRSF